MAINLPSFTGSVDNIQKLSDKPNETDGLSAQGLKARFDKAGMDIKSFLNGTLIPKVANELTKLDNKFADINDSIDNIEKDVENCSKEIQDNSEQIELNKELLSQKKNKITYSLEKVATGDLYFDNRPVYLIAIPVTLSSTDSTINISNLKIDEIIEWNGSVKNERDKIPLNYYVKLKYADVGEHEYFVSTSISSDLIYVRNSVEYAGMSGRLYLKYVEKAGA